MENNDTLHLQRLREYWEDHRSFPSMAKLCAVVGMGSTASVFEMVERLEKSGFLLRQEGRVTPTDKFLSGRLFKYENNEWLTEEVTWPAAMGLMLLAKKFLMEMPPAEGEALNGQGAEVLLMQSQSTAAVGDIVLKQSGTALQLLQIQEASGGSGTSTPTVFFETRAFIKRDDGELESGIIGVLLASFRKFKANRPE